MKITNTEAQTNLVIEGKGEEMIIHTIGYGRTTKAEFLKRVKELPLGTLFVDVRIVDSKSRNGRWAWWGYPLDVTLGEVGMRYRTTPLLANLFPNTVSGLKEYRTSLYEEIITKMGFADLANRLRNINPDDSVCLLCAERKPFKASGRPNCHRVVLAEELVRELGEGWEVMHL